MKKIRFMDTSFRDGFQSCYGARVLTPDFLPALEASVEAGIRHFEAGGGARFQSLFFYCNESAFDMMGKFREVAGEDADLQTLARGINVVALSQQPKNVIDLHAKLFRKHGITTIRNFDALNDVRNLEYSGECIKKHGLRHQIVITLMDLPPDCSGAHTVEFYLEKLKRILDSGIPFDSICFKDASGTANPRKVYETVKEARRAVPEETVLWFHTHDTAGTGVSQNLAAVEAGITGIDLSKSPCSGGTCQTDVLTMVHALKGTGYTLDVDLEKILVAEEVFEECMKDYFMPPEARETSPLIPLSPMPGGALTANTMMMRDTNTLHLFKDVIKEMPVVVSKGGFGTSVTPVSQFYFQQAYLNVTQGRWKKITPGYGEMVLGYFGKTPCEPDPEVVAVAKEQMGKPRFEGNPLDLLEDSTASLKQTLKENGLPDTEENLFILASCESKGLDFMLGKTKPNVRKQSKAGQREAQSASKEPLTPARAAPEGERNYEIVVDGKSHLVTVKPSASGAIGVGPSSASASAGSGTEITAPAPGVVLKIASEAGTRVEKDETLLVLEAMKMETEIKAPEAGEVKKVLVAVGDSINTGDPLLAFATKGS